MANLNFKKITQKISNARGKDKLKIEISPYRDWGIFLAIFFILLIVIAIASAYLFIQIKNEEIFTKERALEEEIEMLDIKALKSTIEFFDVRDENFNNILEQKPDIIDPSL